MKHIRHSTEVAYDYLLARRRVWAKTDGRCFYCGAKVSDLYRDSTGVDHVLPYSKYPDCDAEWNYVGACTPCNSQKGNREVEEFRALVARYKAGWPYFTPRQLAWILAQPFPQPPEHVFYGETLGLKLPTYDDRPRCPS